MATNKQKLAIAEHKRNPQQPMGKILDKVGYSKGIVKNPQALTESNAWKDYLATIDDTLITDKWKQWATDDDDRTNAIKAGDNIMKLKNRYPSDREERATPTLNILVKELVVEGGGESDHQKDLS